MSRLPVRLLLKKGELPLAAVAIRSFLWDANSKRRRFGPGRSRLQQVAATTTLGRSASAFGLTDRMLALRRRSSRSEITALL